MASKPEFEEVTREDAVGRQLDSAIRLYVDGEDPVSVRTLAGAAEGMLKDMLHEKGMQTLDDRIDEVVVPEFREKVRKAIRKPTVYFKHGRLGKNKIKFYPGSTEAVLFTACMDAADYGIPDSAERRIFAGLFIAKFPDILQEGDFKNLIMKKHPGDFSELDDSDIRSAMRAAIKTTQKHMKGS